MAAGPVLSDHEPEALNLPMMGQKGGEESQLFLKSPRSLLRIPASHAISRILRNKTGRSHYSNRSGGNIGASLPSVKSITRGHRGSSVPTQSKQLEQSVPTTGLPSLPRTLTDSPLSQSYCSFDLDA